MTLTLAGVTLGGTAEAGARLEPVGGSDPETRRFFDSGELDICGGQRSEVSWGQGVTAGDT